MFRFIASIFILSNLCFAQNFIVSNTNELMHALSNSEINNENNVIQIKKGIYEIPKSLKFNSKQGFDLKVISYENNVNEVVLKSDKQIFNYVNTNNSTLSFENITLEGGDSSTNAGLIFSNQNLEFINCKITSEAILKRNLIFTVKNLKILNTTIIY